MACPRHFTPDGETVDSATSPSHFSHILFLSCFLLFLLPLLLLLLLFPLLLLLLDLPPHSLTLYKKKLPLLRGTAGFL